METIYYGYVPPVRDRQLSKGCLRAALRASWGDRNNIPNTSRYKYLAANPAKGKEIYYIKSSIGFSKSIFVSYFCNYKIAYKIKNI